MNAETDQAPGPGRAAQRRRTRKAIVDATAQLLSAGADPSVTDIAAAADVSRRTIYTYFPTLDQLLLDAAIGAMNLNVDATLGAVAEQAHRRRAAGRPGPQARLPADQLDRAGPGAGPLPAQPGPVRAAGLG